MKAVLIAIAVLFGGCAPTFFMLRNPKTEQIVQCTGISSYRRRAANNAEYCARSYERYGYARIPRS